MEEQEKKQINSEEAASDKAAAKATDIEIPQSVTTHLALPIEMKDGSGRVVKTIKSVTLRRPKVRDRLVVSKKGGDVVVREFNLICLLSGLTDEELHEMDCADYGEVEESLGKLQYLPGDESDE